MLRGVIFDFDGVIVDSHPVHKRAWKKFFQSMGRTVSEEDLQYLLDGRTRDDILRHFLGELDREKIIEYGHRKEEMFREESASVQIVSGLETFLSDMDNAQFALGIASSGSRRRVNFLLAQLGLAKRFQVIVTGDDVEHGKPDPAVFLGAAQGLQMDPADLVAFEDAASGVKAAKAAGMMCVGIAQPHSSSILLDAGATHVVGDFRSLSVLKLQHLFSSASRSYS